MKLIRVGRCASRPVETIGIKKNRFRDSIHGPRKKTGLATSLAKTTTAMMVIITMTVRITIITSRGSRTLIERARPSPRYWHPNHVNGERLTKRRLFAVVRGSSNGKNSGVIQRVINNNNNNNKSVGRNCLRLKSTGSCAAFLMTSSRHMPQPAVAAATVALYYCRRIVVNTSRATLAACSAIE